ncbi:SDR family NAD(P)-dependent oxidoreductase [Nocardia vinacea]|uniref:SDR family NAD(P)-dependent oxidoreductase n=1 Tax=Nocardia vinacea TaxID=96468 RepID=A0ABZ1YR16_9NOCA|nr:SDR family NAD(P)-dependent oxidoreductase [Nocardia vinacea]
MRLAGKTVVITGAGSGLGREAALLFAHEGASVVVTDLIEKRATDVAAHVRENGGAAVGLRADVRSESDLDTAVETAVSEFGRLDVMFANAGVPPEGFGSIPLEEFSLEAWHAVNEVVLTGVFLSCKVAVKAKRDARSGCATG